MIKAIDGYLVKGGNYFAFGKFVCEHEASVPEF
jgi:hypothetical protein